MPLRIERFVVGPLQENAYLLADDLAGVAVLVDPGDEASRLLGALGPLDLREVWLTHAHFDHVGALADVLAARPIPVRLHPLDRPLLERAGEVSALWGVPVPQPDVAAMDLRDLADGDELELGSSRARALFTPGHAPGHVALHLPAEGAVLAGDALFRGSVGRTDLPGGDARTLIASIRERLLTLPPDTRVLPGHGPETTVAREAATNPFLA